jgi:hypothetical protein
MLNSALGTMIKHIKKENLSSNMYIQYFENIKNYFSNIKSIFYFVLVYLTNAPSLFNIQTKKFTG